LEIRKKEIKDVICNMNKANIFSVQMRSEIGQSEENFRKIGQLIEKSTELEPDFIVLPEFFNTDISVDEFKKLCEKEDTSETLAVFSKIAKKSLTSVWYR
jgi:predicted amidohydrolase